MLDCLESAPDMIAARIEGRLSRDELLEIAARVEGAFERNEKTHLHAEIADYHGFDLTALGAAPLGTNRRAA